MDFLAKSNQKKIQEALTNFELSEYTDGGDVIPLNTKTPIIGPVSYTHLDTII